LNQNSILDKKDIYNFLLKEEIVSILNLYVNEMNLNSDVDLNEISEFCVGLSGADIKSIVCDSLVKAFHRAHKNLKGQNEDESNFEVKLGSNVEDLNSIQEKLQSSIKIERNDLTTSIDTFKKTINKSEREDLKEMYENWKTIKKMQTNNQCNIKSSEEKNDLLMKILKSQKQTLA
jgi:SpoVK/Ycf46/Vps4 family AAA+-type ATPase